MFQINAVLNPSAVDDVMRGLQDEDIHGVTMFNVSGKGCLDGRDGGMSEKVMLIVLVADESFKERAMEAIRANAQDTQHGSGKMWVTSLLEVERIRTGDKDTNALSQTVVETEVHTIDIEAFTAVDTPAS